MINIIKTKHDEEYLKLFFRHSKNFLNLYIKDNPYCKVGRRLGLKASVNKNNVDNNNNNYIVEEKENKENDNEILNNQEDNNIINNNNNKFLESPIPQEIIEQNFNEENQ